MGNLKFNGKSTEELGLFIQTPPSYTFPEKDISSVHIPGRNGDLHIDNKSFKNVDRVYAIAKGFGPGTTLYSNAQEILSWLTSANGKYVRLEDTYDSEVYRLAMFNMGGSFINYFDDAASLDISFNCKPQRFLKSGDDVLNYKGSMAVIENLTGYTSLPKIELVNVPSEVEDVLMVTVTDSENQNVSNITLNHVAQDKPDNVVVVIDSDEQTINRKFEDSIVNVAPYVGLNAMPFPELRKGNTTIALKKYESEDTGLIESYDSFMNKKARKIGGLYKPVNRIANENEKMVLIRSWETLVNEAKKNNIEEAYQSYLQSIAEEFTFPSVNDILDSIGKSTMEFTGNLADNGLPEYDFVTITQTGDNYNIKAKLPGFFMIKGDPDWKTLKYFNANSTLESALPKSNVVQVMYYPVKSGTHELDLLKSDDLPDWLTYSITYGESPAYSPQEVIIKTTSNEGYYYIPKSEGILAGLLSKAHWEHNHNVSEKLKSYEWSSSKKAFVGSEGINKKTNVNYSFKYIDSIKQYKFDTQNKEVQYFEIYDKSPTSYKTALNLLGLKATKDGWYIIIKGDETESLNYRYLTIGEEIGDINGTTNFKVSYIPGDPDRTYINSEGKTIHRPLISYTKEKGWPEWLYPYPLNENYEEFDIFANKVVFRLDNTDDTEKAYASKFYMWFGANDESERNVLNFTSPKYIENKDIYVIQNADGEESKVNTNFSFYVYQINEVPKAFPNDRSIVLYRTDTGSVLREMSIEAYNNLAPFSTHAFAMVEIIGEPPEREGDEDTRQISYRAKKSGYFRWDTNSAWVYKNADDESNNGLLMTSLKDDVTIYYTEHLPQYSEDDIKNMYDKIELVPRPEETEYGGENPTNILIRVKNGNDGYYRANNSVDWKYYKSGDTILVSKVNETNQVFHLIPKDDTLDNMEINIIPRWWKL